MELKITMTNGKEYKIHENIEDFIATTKNQLGILINGFIEIDIGVYINPNHISEILVLKEAENIEFGSEEINVG